MTVLILSLWAVVSGIACVKCCDFAQNADWYALLGSLCCFESMDLLLGSALCMFYWGHRFLGSVKSHAAMLQTPFLKPPQAMRSIGIPMSMQQCAHHKHCLCYGVFGFHVL